MVERRSPLLPSLFSGPSVPVQREANPFTTLHREMNRMFDDVLRGFGAPMQMQDMVMTPSVDIVEGNNELRITADLPGVSQNDVDVTLNEDVLTIQGEKKAEREDKQQNYHVMERSYGAFSRSIRLPFMANPDQVQAAFRDGVLTVTLPKPAEVQNRERRIQIQGEQAGKRESAGIQRESQASGRSRS